MRRVSAHRDRLIQGRRELMWKNQELKMQMEMMEKNQMRNLGSSLRSQLEETARTMTRTMMEMAPHLETALVVVMTAAALVTLQGVTAH